MSALGLAAPPSSVRTAPVLKDRLLQMQFKGHSSAPKSPSNKIPANAKPSRRYGALHLSLVGCAILVFALSQGLVHGQGFVVFGHLSGGAGSFLRPRKGRNPLFSRGPIHLELHTDDADFRDHTETDTGDVDSISTQEEELPAGETDTYPAWGLFSGGAAYVALLERELDSKATVGQCEKGRPLLPGIPAHVCQPLFCLWSHLLKVDVDLSFSLMQKLPEELHLRHCPIAQGGQIGGAQLVGTPPLVSLILLAGQDDFLAAQTFIQLFRTAHEVPSAEFIIVESSSPAHASTGDRRRHQLLQSVAGRVRSYFGTHVKLLPGGSEVAPVGHWAQAQAGLEAASGSYAIVVPAGTFVLRGWLNALLFTFEANPRAAVVGPLVLSQAGVVADAGGRLERDGSITIIGAGSPPQADLLHMRRVDFVGPTCVAVRREAALAAGGWDPKLSWHLGGVDLALAVQQRGQLVLLQPLSVVMHAAQGQQRQKGLGASVLAGVSHNGSSSSAVQAAIPAAAPYNEELQHLQEKWQQVLPERGCTTAAEQVSVATDVGEQLALHNVTRGMPRVLWIDDKVPTPDKDSGSVRLLALMKILVGEGYQISLQPRRSVDPHYTLAVRAAGVRVLPVDSMQLRASGPEGRCLYDVFVVARRPNYNNTYKILDEACPGVPQIFDTVDLHFLREAREELSLRSLQHLSSPPDLVRWLRSAAPLLSQHSTSVATLLQHRDNEVELARRAAATLVVSEDEVQVLQHYLPEQADRLHLVSNIHQSEVTPMALAGPVVVDGAPAPSSCEERRGLIFVGNYLHKPNVDAVVFLVNHVLPRIRKKLPDEIANGLQAHIVGSGVLPPDVDFLLRHNYKFVTFHGYLPDDLLQLLYSSVKVAVAPLTTGAGVKGKVNQAMKLGVPVVATSIAVEGMHAKDGRDCLIADTAEEFANKIVSLYTDCSLWTELVQGGQANLREHFSVETARAALLRALNQAGVPAPLPLQQADCGWVEA